MPAQKSQTSFEKIANIIKLAPRLNKTEENKSDGYAFVPIDKYYEIIAKLLAENGVIWFAHQKRADFVDGVDPLVIRFDYRFEAYDGDVKIHECEHSIFQPFSGAQDTGKAVSYAEKVFLRGFLKLVTGEPDADSNPQLKRQSSAREKRDAANVVSIGIKALSDETTGAGADEVLKKIVEAETLSQLEAVRIDNGAFLNKLRSVSPAKWKLLQGAYHNRMENLSNEE